MFDSSSMNTDSSQILSQEFLGMAQAAVLDKQNSPEEIFQQIEFIKHKLGLRLADHVENSPWDEALYRAPWLTAQIETLRAERARLRNELLTLPPANPSAIESEEARTAAHQAWETFGEAFVECEANEGELLSLAYESERVEGV